IKLVDQYQNVVTSFNGDKNLTFSGLGNAPDGSVPTVTSKTGSAVNLGTATTITFASGQSSAGGSLVAYKAEGPGTLAAPDGTVPTVTSKTGAAVNLGTATTITFTSGQSSAGGSLVASKPEGPVTLAATDGTLSTSTAGGSGVSLTISAAAANAYRITAAT